MVIQHVLAPARFGGTETVVRSLAAGLRRRGHDVSVVAVLSPEDVPGHPFVAELDAEGVPVFTLEVPPRAYWRERRELGRLLRAFPPDVVHTHGFRSDVLHAPAAMLAGIPVVSTVHGFTGGDAKNRVYQWVQRKALPFLDRVVAVSAPLARELRAAGVPDARLRTIPNGPPVGGPAGLSRAGARRTLEVPARGSRLGWVGRLSAEKGPDVFLDALAVGRASGGLPADVCASILGDGPLRPELEEKARATGLHPCVRWHGAVPGAARLLRAFDVLVLSSRTEGTPIVLLEALVAGVPVVATGVGGVPDAARGRAVRLVPPEDPVALAEAIAAELVERGSRAGRGGNGGPRSGRALPGVEASGPGAASGSPAARGTDGSQAIDWLTDYENLYREVALVRSPRRSRPSFATSGGRGAS